MGSRRVYITLNEDKESDRIISSYLSQSYSESDAIKEALYRLATNNALLMQNETISTQKERFSPKRQQRVKKDTKSKGDNKVLKGADSNKKVEKVPNTDSTEKVQNDDIYLDLTQIDDKSVNEVQKDSISDKLKQNELEQLKEFM